MPLEQIAEEVELVPIISAVCSKKKRELIYTSTYNGISYQQGEGAFAFNKFEIL